MSRVWLFNARRYTDKNGVDNCSVSYIPLDMGEPDTATSRGGLATVDHKLPGRVFDQLTSAPAVYEIVAYQEQVTWVGGGQTRQRIVQAVPVAFRLIGEMAFKAVPEANPAGGANK
jgi:hypothetical protein